MGGDEEAIASVTEPLGREVVLLKGIWDDKITRDHPELAGHLDAILSAVIARPRRSRLFARSNSPLPAWCGPQPVAAGGRKL